MGSVLEASKYDLDIFRPWLKDGRSWVTLKDHESGGTVDVLRKDLQAKLTKAQWHEIDKIVTKSFMAASPLTHFICGQNLIFRTDGLPRTVLTPTLTDEEAAEEEKSLPIPVYQARSLPLPITHCRFQLPGSKGEAEAITDMDGLGESKEPIKGPAEAAHAVGRAVEKTFVESVFSQENANQTLLTNNPLKSAESMVHLLTTSRFYGPFMALHNCDVDTFAGVKGVNHIIKHEMVPRGQLAVVQLTPNVIRAVIGLEPIAVQWEDGYKVMAIIVLQVRADFYNNVGIVVGKPKEQARDGR